MRPAYVIETIRGEAPRVWDSSVTGRGAGGCRNRRKQRAVIQCVHQGPSEVEGERNKRGEPYGMKCLHSRRVLFDPPCLRAHFYIAASGLVGRAISRQSTERRLCNSCRCTTRNRKRPTGRARPHA